MKPTDRSHALLRRLETGRRSGSTGGLTMRFNTPEEVKEWAAKAAASDYRFHRSHNMDLNPFCTEGARDDWQRGFDNVGPRSYERREGQSDEEAVAFDTIYQRGRAMALLLEEKKLK